MFPQIDQRPLLKATIQASVKKPYGIIDTANVAFRNLDLSDVGIHKVKFYTNQLQDLRRTNDTLSMELYSQACELGDITGFTKDSGERIHHLVPQSQTQVQFLRNDMFRIWMAYDGIFYQPCRKDLIINTPEQDVKPNLSENQEYYLLQTTDAALQFTKNLCGSPFTGR